MLLGYDLDPGDEGRTLAAYLTARQSLSAEGEVPIANEVSLLALFADFAELSRNRPAGEDQHVENRVHSPRERFHTFLQTMDIERGALPEEFHQRLLRVLRHYGVESLDRTRELDNAVFRVFLAQQRSAPDVQLVMAFLQHWMNEPVPADPAAGRGRARGAGPARARHPAAVPHRRRPGPQRAVPLVRPAARRRRACGRAGVGARAGGAARRPAGRRGPRRADRRARRDPRADRPVPPGAARERHARRPSRCSRSSSGGTTASTSWTT